MSADNITEGPWQSQHDFDMDGVRRIIGAIDGPDDGRFHYKVICEVDPDDSLDTKEQIANARMIAAAPELHREGGAVTRRYLTHHRQDHALSGTVTETVSQFAGAR